ncbi:hypothetical protein ACSMXM_01200 [Pacificimonas sp. ICDLI1SI03]
MPQTPRTPDPNDDWQDGLSAMDGDESARIAAEQRRRRKMARYISTTSGTLDTHTGQHVDERPSGKRVRLALLAGADWSGDMVTDEQVEVPAHDDIDGMKWAKAFCHRFPSVELDDALGWFCNAIMAGYDTARNKYEPVALAAEQVSGWRPIEDAPKDGSIILITSVSPLWKYPFPAKWDGDWWLFADEPLNDIWGVSNLVSHWMPLPPLPTEEQSS